MSTTAANSNNLIDPTNPRSLPYVAHETALLFVDMQKVWVYPGLDEDLTEKGAAYYYPRLESTVIPNQVALLNAFRDKKTNVLHTIIESLTVDGRDRSPDHKLSNINVPKGCPEGQVIDELAPIVNEIVLPKTSSGVFNSSQIDYVLRNLNVKYLVIAGVVTDQCVDMAVRDAADRGYIVTLVEDACATVTPERHQHCLDAIKGYCWITDTKTVVKQISTL